VTPALLALLLGPVVPGSITTPEAIEQCIQETQAIPACAALPAGQAEACEICTLRYRERDLKADLVRALGGRSEERLEAEALAARLASAVRERDEAEQGARTRATWALGLGAAGAAALAVGVVLGEPWAIGGGTLAVAAGVVVARW
jgi:hypothetical protein